MSGSTANQFTTIVPPGDTRERSVCTTCDFVHYENPKVVVGVVATYEGRILLARRDIEPRRGHWTIPAGYLELGESLEAGACREAREETAAVVDTGPLLCLYSVPRISQVLAFFRASMRTPDCEAGDETSEVALLLPGEIPWDEIAFPSVTRVLRHHLSFAEGAVVTPDLGGSDCGPLPPNGQPLADASVDSRKPHGGGQAGT